jgi:hypothetical protein
MEMSEHAEHPKRMVNGAWAREHLSVDERDLRMIELGASGRAALMTYWLGEWAVTFGWALGILPHVPAPDVVGDFETLFAAVPLPPCDPGSFFRDARFAVTNEVLRAELRRLVDESTEWLERFPTLPREETLVLARSRAIERGRAASWLLERIENDPSHVAP